LKDLDDAHPFLGYVLPTKLLNYLQHQSITGEIMIKRRQLWWCKCHYQVAKNVKHASMRNYVGGLVNLCLSMA